MIQTESAKFQVHSIEQTHLWLEVLHGGDQGMRVSIGRYASDQSEEVNQTLRSLSEGDVVEAELCRVESSGSSWMMESVTTSQDKACYELIAP